MKRDVDRCLDCPRYIVRRSVWKTLDAAKKADPQFSAAVNGRCEPCYRYHRQIEIKVLRGEMRFTTGSRTTFCGCGCWIFIGENCPNCQYELLKENAA